MMKKRVLSVLTAAAMLLSFLPTAALAEEISQEHCSCVSLCTEGDIHPDCPVCGAADAELSTVCKPAQPDPEPDTEPEPELEPEPEPEPDPEPTLQTVTGWSWVDEGGVLSGNALTVPNQGGDAPAWEQVASWLPTKVTATVAEVSDPVVLALGGWSCPDYDPAAPGRYAAVTTLADDTYTLGADVTPLTLAVELAPPEDGANLLEANTVTAGAFTLTSDSTLTENTDYSYEGNTLTIKSGTAITISTSSPTTSDHIVVEDGVTANITLNGVSIDVSGTGNACAFEVAGKAVCNLTLAAGSTNTLKSGSGKAGLQVQNKNGQTANLTITEANAGSLTAIGGYGGAGIGGSSGGAGGIITINGGIVTAISGNYSAGIGGGSSGAGGAITINGGSVIATGSGNGAGIGGDNSMVSVASGSFSTGKGNAFIVASSIQDKTNQTSWSGVIFEGDNGKVHGSAITLTTDAEIPAGKTLTNKKMQRLTVGNGVTLTNNGTITNNSVITNDGTITNDGVLTNNGTIENHGSIRGTGTISGSGTVTTDEITVGDFTLTSNSGLVAGTDYSYADNILTIKSGKNITISGTSTNQDRIVVDSSCTGGNAANITLNGVDIQFHNGDQYHGGTCAFEVAASAACNLTLADSSVNTLQSGYSKAGLRVHENATLTITDGSAGQLNVNGGSGAASIGGQGYNEKTGTIAIESGTVIVDGAIGNGSGDQAEGATVTIGTNHSAPFLVASEIRGTTDKDSWNGVVFLARAGKVYGSPTISTNAEIPADYQLYLQDKLTINDGVTLTNNGLIVKETSAVNTDGITNNGLILAPTNADAELAEDGYTYANRVLTFKTDAALTPTCKSPDFPLRLAWDGSVTTGALTLDGVNFTSPTYEKPVLAVAENQTITLHLKGTNTLTGGEGNADTAGNKPGSAAVSLAGTLNLTGAGTLTATGGKGGNNTWSKKGADGGDGIAGTEGSAGTLTIQNGVTLIATGGAGGAGGNKNSNIGGESLGGDGGAGISNVTITNDGTITATGGGGGKGGDSYNQLYGNGRPGGVGGAGISKATITNNASGTVTATGGTGGTGGKATQSGGTGGTGGTGGAGLDTCTVSGTMEARGGNGGTGGDAVNSTKGGAGGTGGAGIYAGTVESGMLTVCGGIAGTGGNSSTGAPGSIGLPVSGNPTVESGATLIKPSQTPPNAPTKSSATADSITLNAVSGSGHGALQYGYQAAGETSPGYWQTDTTFTGLNTATAYTFFARFAGNDYYNPAVSASGTEIYTLPETPGSGAVTIDYAAETITFANTLEVNTAEGFNGTEISSGGSITNYIQVTAQTIYVRVKAVSGGAPASEAQSVTVPKRPDAPMLTIDTATERVTISNEYLYGTTDASYESITTAGTGSTVTVDPDTSIYIYKAATSGEFKSAIQTLTAPARGTTPNVTINFSTEKLNTADTMQYSTNSGTSWADCTADMAPTAFDNWDGTAEKAVQFRTEATDDAYASEVQTVTIPKRPDAPTGIKGVNETVEGKNDGQITGVSPLMEYKISTGDWTDCSSDPLWNLAPGTYSVRLKAVTTDGSQAFAGAAATVTIATGAERTYTLNVTAPGFDPVIYGYTQPEAKAVTIRSTGNSDATISGVTVSGTNAASFTLNKTDGVTITAGGTDSATYTVRPNASLGAGTYTATITVTYNNDAKATATVSFTVNPAAQDAPGAPVEESKTYNSVTLETMAANANGAAAQYSIDNGTTWQDSPIFIGLAPSTEYSFVARYAAVTNYVASPAGEAVEITTNSAPSGGSNPTYKPEVTQPEKGGTVAVSPASPKRGDKVTVTTKPEDGYEVDKIIVTDKDGKPVEVKDNGDGTFSFTQPSGTVKIEVIYKPETPWDNPFTDVPENAWYHDSVAYVVEKGLFFGTSETKFSPGATMTRAMLMTVLARADGQDTTAPEGGKWYDVGMKWAVEQGISDGTNPDGNISREQLATMLWRYAGSPATSGTLASFTDAGKVSDYAQNAMRWAVEQGIIAGKGSGILDPKGNATRAEAAAMLMRFLSRVEN